jgi:hypothetical protein
VTTGSLKSAYVSGLVSRKHIYSRIHNNSVVGVRARVLGLAPTPVGAAIPPVVDVGLRALVAGAVRGIGVAAGVVEGTRILARLVVL